MKPKPLVTTGMNTSIEACIKFPAFSASLRYFRGSGGADNTLSSTLLKPTTFRSISYKCIWKPTKVFLISSGWPSSALASVIESWYLRAQQRRELLLIQFIDALADVVRKHKMRADKPIRLSVSVR